MKKKNSDKFDFFGEIKIDQLREYEKKRKNFEKYYITIYDHWLNEEEASGAFLSYCQVGDDGFTMKNYKEYQDKYFKLFDMFFNSSEIYSFNDDFNSNKEIFRISSKTELENILSESLKEIHMVNFVIPQLEIIVMSNFDLTLPIFLKPSNKKVIKMIEDVDLFLL
ncbi:MAG: hypothetical protein GY830_00535 [Bacteroidetes bacterium]|nr:hypothetical protein [Bacteroidota bacterium]